MGITSRIPMPGIGVGTESQYFLVAFAGDQITKLVVATMLPLHAALPVASDWLIFRHEENCAGGGGLPRLWGIIYLGVFVLAGWNLVKYSPHPGGAALMLGGAAGNILNMFVGFNSQGIYIFPTLFTAPGGCVVDWIQLFGNILGTTVGTGAPVFNVADWMIMTGLLMVSGVRSAWIAYAGGFVMISAVGMLLHIVRQLLLGH
jgi:lipoprotein signal peptidase